MKREIGSKYSGHQKEHAQLLHQAYTKNSISGTIFFHDIGRGDQGKEDYKITQKLLQRNHSQGLFMLCLHYEVPWYFERDFEEAKKYWKEAAEVGWKCHSLIVSRWIMKQKYSFEYSKEEYDHFHILGMNRELTEEELFRVRLSH